MPTLKQRPPLCSDLSRLLAEDPIGTAPHWPNILVLELAAQHWLQVQDPERWTAEQRSIFAALSDKVAASGQGFGLLLCQVPPTTPLTIRRYTRGASGYERRDHLLDAPQERWDQGLQAGLLDTGLLGGWQEKDIPVGLDYYVCTNGRIDAACGKYGIPVYEALRRQGIRAWRTAHFGGHRFAATALELPTGLMWAHLKPDLAVRLAARAAAPSEVAQHLRGFCGIPHLTQPLDRALLLRFGWPWLGAARQAEVQERQLQLSFVLDGRNGLAQAQLEFSDPLCLPNSSHTWACSLVEQYRLGEVQITWENESTTHD